MPTTRRRRGLAAAVLAAAVAAAPSAAWAHATFAGSEAAPPDADVRLTLDVPEERGPAMHNARIVVEVPAGFAAVGCEPKAEWDCATSRSGGRTLITWSRSAGADPNSLFPFRVRTPAKPGGYPFEVNQFYADGEAARWDGPPDSDYPAPVLEVR